jgi:glycosyltransferase involved in cell wall biosynthesis
MPTVAFDARDAADPRARGWGRHARCLLGALRELGDPDVLALQRGWPWEAAWEQVGLPLRARRAAVLHVPNCFLPLRRPCPGVVTVHDLAFEDHPEDFRARTRIKYRSLAPRAARSAERVICVSDFTRADVCRRYGVAEQKVRVIPNAPALPAGEEPAPDGPYLLAVGDLRPKKNHARLVAAWLSLRGAGLPHRLVIAGVDAGEGARLRAVAGPAPLELTGWVADARLDALLRGADALVHPSLYEGFGLAMVEAMVRGIPVAAARATALPEVAGDAAEWFDPLDAGDIARAVGGVLGDSGLRAELARRGRARAGALSWEASARATASVYRELL